MNRRISAGLGLIGLVLIMGAPAAFATTYYGPQFNLPVSIPPGGTIHVVLTTGSGPSIVPLPQGSDPPCTPSGSPTHCGPYTQQDWTVATGCFYSVHRVAVSDPNGNGYLLGSATTSGLFWPSSLGGGGSGTAVPPNADALNVTVGDSFDLAFGAGTGGFTFTSVLGNPPNDVSPAGPYYWWTTSGNTIYGSNVRTDTQPLTNPTLAHGSYVVDIEGVVACPTGTTSFTTQLFFDAGIIVTTPEFSFSLGIVVASGLAMMILLKKRGLIPARN